MPVVPIATQDNSEASIKTPLGKDVLLLHTMTMTEEMGRLFTIDLELYSTQEDIKFEDVLGQNVTIEVNLIPDGKRFFNGHVTRFSQSGNSGNYAVYQATVRPWFWFLTRTADCRIFQDQTVPDIVKQIFRDMGYTDFEDRLTANYRTWDYCVQYRETDFNFVSRLLEQEGIYYYFTHEDGVHKLILSDDYSAHEPLPGAAEISYYPPDSTTVREGEIVTSWYISKQVQPGKYELNEFDFERPRANLTSKSEVSREHSVSDYEIYDYPGEYVKTDNGDNYVQARIEELHSQYEQAQGQSDVRVLNTGGLFTLAEYPREDQNREYLIVSATHHVNGDFFGSGGSAGTRYSNSFSVIESSTPYRASRITPKPIIQGAQTAIVVGPSGEEIHTDEYGRVILQFHWDRYGKSDENSSCWVRVAQLWAGKKWGGIHIPRIGQEVIVEFLEGDPDRPIITGRVYNADQMPPYDLPANKTQSGIKSRSSKNGTSANFNEIRMEDKKGKEQLYIHAEKNQDNIVENDETTDVGHDRTEKVGHDERITVEHNRWVEVKNDEDIQVGNDSFETVDRNKDIHISGNRTKKVVLNETSTIIGNQTQTITGNQVQTITGTQTEVIMGTLTQAVVGGMTIVTPASYTLIATGGYKLIAPSSDSIFKALDFAVTGAKFEAVGSANAVTASKIEATGMSIAYTAAKIENETTKFGTSVFELSSGATKIVNKVITIFS